MNIVQSVIRKKMLRLILGILIHEGLIKEERGKFIYDRLGSEFPPKTLDAVLSQIDRVLSKVEKED